MDTRGPVIDRPAGEPIAELRAVRVTGGKVYLASSGDLAELAATVGISRTAAAAIDDTVRVQVAGVITDGSWSWTPGAPVYVGTDGALTQTAPANALQIAVAETATQIYLGQPGRSAAAAASSNQISRTAGENLSGHRAVRIADGEAYYASSDDPSTIDATVGLTTGAATAGDSATIQTAGPLTHAGWAWTPGAPVYVGTDGAVTQTPPTAGVVLQIGFAETATQIFIEPQQAIRRA